VQPTETLKAKKTNNCEECVSLFVQERATKWQSRGEIDGLTTNGVLIMHPHGSFTDQPAMEVDGAPGGLWREVSVGGGVFTLRESRSAQQKGLPVENEDNILQVKWKFTLRCYLCVFTLKMCLIVRRFKPQRKRETDYLQC
jgi:hypothetical protein